MPLALFLLWLPNFQLADNPVTRIYQVLCKPALVRKAVLKKNLMICKINSRLCSFMICLSQLLAFLPSTGGEINYHNLGGQEKMMVIQGCKNVLIFLTPAIAIFNLPNDIFEINIK